MGGEEGAPYLVVLHVGGSSTTRSNCLKNKNKKVRYGKSGVRHMGEMGAVGETHKYLAFCFLGIGEALGLPLAPRPPPRPPRRRSGALGMPANCLSAGSASARSCVQESARRDRQDTGEKRDGGLWGGGHVWGDLWGDVVGDVVGDMLGDTLRGFRGDVWGDV